MMSVPSPHIINQVQILSSSTQ